MKMDIITLGTIIVFIGIFIIILGSLTNANKNDAKFAVGGIIGFIPFGFGNDKKLVFTTIAVTAFLFIVFLIFSEFLFN